MTKKYAVIAIVGAALLLLVQAAVAANINGRWDFIFYSDNGEYPNKIAITVKGDQAVGKIGKAELKGTFKDGALELAGDFYAEEAGYSAALKIHGKLEGDKLKGAASWDMYDLTFTATRSK